MNLDIIQNLNFGLNVYLANYHELAPNNHFKSISLPFLDTLNPQTQNPSHQTPLCYSLHLSVIGSSQLRLVREHSLDFIFLPGHALTW